MEYMAGLLPEGTEAGETGGGLEKEKPGREELL